MKLNTVKHSDGTFMTAIRMSGCRTVFGCGFTKQSAIRAAKLLWSKQIKK